MQIMNASDLLDVSSLRRLLLDQNLPSLRVVILLTMMVTVRQTVVMKIV